MKQPNGNAALIIVFVICLTAILIGTSLIKTGFAESLMGRNTGPSLQAYYAANSGIEDAIYKIQSFPNFGNPSASFSLSIGTNTVDISITGTKEQRVITSVGVSGQYARKLQAIVQNTTILPGFTNAIHAGANGFELDGNTTITAKTGDGNVYSNGFIKGKNKGNGDCTNGSPSFIKGNAWAVTDVDKLTPGDGVCVVKDIYANNLLYCTVLGTRNSPSDPNPNCPGGTYVQTSAAPTPVPLPDMNVAQLKNNLTNKGVLFEGNCIADGSANASNCAGPGLSIGNMIITGNLTVNVPAGKRLNFSNPVWVKGSVTFNSNSTVGVALSSLNSQMVVVDGSIISNSNVTFCTNNALCAGGAAFLLFLTTFNPNPPPGTDLCVTPAITISSNTNSVLFYATAGCVNVTANSTFHGAILGEKIRVQSNSVVEYDPALASASFSLAKGGGWQVQSFIEQ